MISEATNIDAISAEEHEKALAGEYQSLGFWLYLMSDLVIFGAIFATYAVLVNNVAGGASGKELFHLPYVFIETMLLLFSSASCGMAILALHRDEQQRVLAWFAVTFLLGLGFIFMEVHEFRSLILEGNGPDRSGFLSAFFTLVGTHGAHVTTGLIWMAVMMGQIKAKGLTIPVRSRLMRLSMFWHFLDIVWVALFTIVYLMGVM